MKQIVLASANAGKIREIRTIVEPIGLELLSMADYNVGPIDEPHPTFAENALTKARTVSARTGLPALADDSGLCVEALDFGPGIHSARFAGGIASDADNNALLLERMLGRENRSAFYYCVMVLVRHPHDPQPIIADGRWHGKIAERLIGDRGFGYDPLFYLPDFRMTAAQLSPAKKNAISHRAIALRRLVAVLQSG